MSLFFTMESNSVKFPLTFYRKESVCIEWQFFISKLSLEEVPFTYQGLVDFKNLRRRNNLGSNKGAGLEFHHGVLDANTLTTSFLFTNALVSQG